MAVSKNFYVLIIFIFGSTIPIVKGQVTPACELGAVWVQNQVKYECVSDGQGGVEVTAVACVPSNTLGGTEYLAGQNWVDQGVKYLCNQTGENTLAVVAVACVAPTPNQDEFAIGTTFSVRTEGIYRCVRTNGVVTMQLRAGCIYNNRLYANGASWIVNGTVQLACHLINGLFLPVATGCISINNTAVDVGANITIGNKTYVCVRSEDDNTTAVLVEIVTLESTTKPGTTGPPEPGISVNFTNVGKKFVQTFLPNKAAIELVTQHHFLLWNTEKPSCTVTITVDEPPIRVYTVLLKNQVIDYTVIAPSARGIKLEAPCNFIVFGIIFDPSAADGWIGIPVEWLGKEYIVLSVDPSFSGNTALVQLSIVAVNANTVCTTKFPNATEVTTTLNELGVAYFPSDLDLTGTRISCSDKVSVFTGQLCSNVTDNCTSCSQSVEQVPPISTLGRTFALVRSSQTCIAPFTCCADSTNSTNCSECSELFRVVATEDNTQLTLNGTSGVQTATLNAGQSRYILVSEKKTASLVSSKPILVGQYFTGKKNEGLNQGPSFSIVPQMESFMNQYQIVTRFASLVSPKSFLVHQSLADQQSKTNVGQMQPFPDAPQIESLDRYQIVACSPDDQDHWINLVCPIGTCSQLLLNGKPFLDPSAIEPIPGIDFETIQYKIDCTQFGTGVIDIMHPQNVNFGLIAFGSGSSISYAFPIGVQTDENSYFSTESQTTSKISESQSSNTSTPLPTLGLSAVPRVTFPVQTQSITAATAQPSANICSWSSWNSWSDCDCRLKMQSRMRYLGKPADCIIEGCGKEIRRCRPNRCPVDCKFSRWASWSRCKGECGAGKRNRRRVIRVPAIDGGKKCKDDFYQEEHCEIVDRSCYSDCGNGHWSIWSDCTPPDFGQQQCDCNEHVQQYDAIGYQTREWTVSAYNSHRCPLKKEAKKCFFKCC